MKLNSCTAIFWIVQGKSLAYKSMFYTFVPSIVFCMIWFAVADKPATPFFLIVLQTFLLLFFTDSPERPIKNLLKEGADIELEKAHAKEILAILGKPELDRAQPSAALRTYLDAMISDAKKRLAELDPDLPQALDEGDLVKVRRQKFAAQKEVDQLGKILRGAAIIRREVHLSVTVFQFRSGETHRGFIKDTEAGVFKVELFYDHDGTSLPFQRDGSTNRWVYGDRYFELP